MDLLERALQLRGQMIARRWPLLAAGAVGLLCFLLVLLRPGLPPQPRQYEVWLAEAELLVDTSDSRVVDTRGLGLESLAARATLLGNLLATAPLRAGVAERAGVDAERLVVTPPPGAVGGEVALPDADAAPEVPDAEALELAVSTDPSLPIVRVLAQAPERTAATRLAEGAIDELSSYVDSARADPALPDARRLVAEGLGPALAQPRSRGPGFGTALLIGLLAALLVAAAALALEQRGPARAGRSGRVPNGRPPRSAASRAKRALAGTPGAGEKQRGSARRRPRSPR